MKNVDDQQDLFNLLGKYFDQALDPQSRDAFLATVNADPGYQEAFLREQAIRENLKKRIYRPSNSVQLTQAIKNQIREV
jgi:hypothetical protein